MTRATGHHSGASARFARPNVRFIQKDGQRIDTATVHKCFFQSALKSGSGPVRATRIWNDMLFGDLYARRLIEKMCEIEIVDANAGFGFLE
jgi:hypothetical protein